MTADDDETPPVDYSRIPLQPTESAPGCGCPVERGWAHTCGVAS